MLYIVNIPCQELEKLDVLSILSGHDQSEQFFSFFFNPLLFAEELSGEDSPKQWKITVHSLGPSTLLHMSPKLFLGRASNTDMMPLENPTLYLLMKMSSASAPSETLHFPLQKPSPFSVSLMSEL